tara:strand:+ start:212 stop:847 length:636 start_codon:yes stop_codon:yes gene_type:complete
MSAQLSLAQLDLRELNDSIPKEIGSVVLVSNADLDLSAGTIQRIHEQGSCLFVHHNHAHNLTRLRHHYPEQSCEMLFIRGNGIGYWGLVDSTKEPFYQRSDAIPHCGIFALRGKLDLSNRPEIQKINLNWLSTLEQQENYPDAKRPSTGFYTRKLFAAIAKQRTELKVLTLGFHPDASYWNSTSVTHHDYVFESLELKRSAQKGCHVPLDC